MTAKMSPPRMARTATAPSTMPAIAPPARLDDGMAAAAGPEVLLVIRDGVVEVEDAGEEVLIEEDALVGKELLVEEELLLGKSLAR
jgi:hypothetical protein